MGRMSDRSIDIGDGGYEPTEEEIRESQYWHLVADAGEEAFLNPDFFLHVQKYMDKKRQGKMEMACHG